MENEKIIEMIVRELRIAEEKHPCWPDDIVHAAAILAEEAGEVVKDALDVHYSGKSTDDLKIEIAQVGAMAIRMLENL
jgi:NTP pyrophosphatase (non-canonical NTP hydrolase)